MAYYSIEPWDKTRDDLNAGIIAATIARCHGNKNAKPSDFTPDYAKPPESDRVKAAKLQVAKSIAKHNNRKPAR